MRVLILLCSAALLVCADVHRLSAQTSPMAGHDMGEMQPVPAPETLPPPIRMSGIGNSHIKIKSTPEAQAWFDQGLSLLHDFWDYESAKAFEQAIRVDPQCAMCWWGLARAEGSRGKVTGTYVKHALAEATRLMPHAGNSDKYYIEAAAAEENAKEDDRTQAQAIYRNLVKKYPKDIEARIFLAESLCEGYNDTGKPKPGQIECIAILEGVLKDAPNDSAVNHYWIHAIEAGNHPEHALKSAALLASLAPTSGHMVHMPGHIYYRVGDYATAEHWFAASTEADERYMREQNVSPDDDWNYMHNLMYAIADEMEQGKFEAANVLSDRAGRSRGKLSASLYIWSARDQVARVSDRLPVALRVADWDAVLRMLGQAKFEGEKTRNLGFLTAELTEYARGMKALDTDDVAAAQAASERMDAGLWRLHQRMSDEPKKETKGDAPPEEEVMPDALPDPILKSLSVESLELRAGILVAQGNLDEAKKLYATSQLEEKNLGYHEPPMYIRPVGETEAAALLKAKDYAGAEAAYERALKERPNSGFGLYGLARVAELEGHTAQARTAYAAFLKAWEHADAGMAQVAHAKENREQRECCCAMRPDSGGAF
jgi:tetratricopeptide (TPR) repeat protein